MASHNELGKTGEQLAADFLCANGYEILERNWTFLKAEIDIIARKQNVLAVVEVKTRSSINFGLPQDFVNPKKIHLLLAAVNAYVEMQDIDNEIRFDIVAIHKTENDCFIEHLVDAFYYF